MHAPHLQESPHRGKCAVQASVRGIYVQWHHYVHLGRPTSANLTKPCGGSRTLHHQLSMSFHQEIQSVHARGVAWDMWRPSLVKIMYTMSVLTLISTSKLPGGHNSATTSTPTTFACNALPNVLQFSIEMDTRAVLLASTACTNLAKSRNTRIQ
jgi:hypothetical protein